jgi:hypothetical protein
MAHQMLRCILDERKFLQAISGDVIIQMQQNAQTGLRDEGVSEWYRNIILAGQIVT